MSPRGAYARCVASEQLLVALGPPLRGDLFRPARGNFTMLGLHCTMAGYPRVPAKKQQQQQQEGTIRKLQKPLS